MIVNVVGFPVGIGVGLTPVTVGPAGSMFTYTHPIVPSEAMASMSVLTVGTVAGDV